LHTTAYAVSPSTHYALADTSTVELIYPFLLRCARGSFELARQCIAGCGKTAWAARHIEENPAKRYVLLSTDSVLQSMRVRVIALPRSSAAAVRHLIHQLVH
jgi:hypothetical protein